MKKILIGLSIIALIGSTSVSADSEVVTLDPISNETSTNTPQIDNNSGDNNQSESNEVNVFTGLRTVQATGQHGNVQWTIYTDNTAEVEPIAGTDRKLPSSIIDFRLVNFTGKITFKEGVVLPNRTNYLFNNYKMESIYFENDASNVTDISNMFQFLQNVKVIDLGSNFDTSNVTKMHGVFYSLPNLVELNLGNKFDTSKVTEMNYMFAFLNSLEHLHLGDLFDTSEVTNMSLMFFGLSSLDRLRLGDKFDTSKVKDMSSMFVYMEELRDLDLGLKFNTSNVTNMLGMFQGLKSIEYLDLGELFDTSNVTSMSFMFSDMESIKSLNLGSKFNTSKVTTMEYMFEDMLSLETLELGSQFDTSKVTSIKGMFSNAKLLKTLDLSGWDTRLMIDMTQAFSRMDSIESLDLSDFDTNHNPIIDLMFNKTPKLNKLTLGSNFKSLVNTGIEDIPSLTGYTNLGWFDKTSDKLFTSSENFMNTYTQADAGTYQWHRRPNTYTITFDPSGGTGTVADQDFVYDVEQVISNNSFEKEGYTFTGWSTEPNGLGTIFEIGDTILSFTDIDQDNITFYAVWERTELTVDFNVSGVITKVTVYYGDNIPFTSIPVPEAIKGYEFKGWFTEEEGKGTQLDLANYEIKETQEIYAYYKANDYFVIYDLDGGVNSSTNNKVFHIGDKLELDFTSVPTKTGYEFVGWEYNGKLFTYENYNLQDNPIEFNDSNIILKAKWKVIETDPIKPVEPVNPKPKESLPLTGIESNNVILYGSITLVAGAILLIWMKKNKR